MFIMIVVLEYMINRKYYMKLIYICIYQTIYNSFNHLRADFKCLIAFIAKALEVKVGLQAVDTGMFPFPPTNKLSNPQTFELTSQTDKFGSFPILVVPIK